MDVQLYNHFKMQTMNIKILIEAALIKVGKRSALALGMKQDAQRISDWKAGRRKPNASEIAYMAHIAGVPILETVAKIEMQMKPEYSKIWEKALTEKNAGRFFQAPA